ncbi:hypothetical protein PCE1_000088 [Barthelona sp. PCE]
MPARKKNTKKPKETEDIDLELQTQQDLVVEKAPTPSRPQKKSSGKKKSSNAKGKSLDFEKEEEEVSPEKKKRRQTSKKGKKKQKVNDEIEAEEIYSDIEDDEEIFVRNDKEEIEADEDIEKDFIPVEKQEIGEHRIFITYSCLSDVDEGLVDDIIGSLDNWEYTEDVTKCKYLIASDVCSFKTAQAVIMNIPVLTTSFILQLLEDLEIPEISEYRLKFERSDDLLDAFDGQKFAISTTIDGKTMANLRTTIELLGGKVINKINFAQFFVTKNDMESEEIEKEEYENIEELKILSVRKFLRNIVYSESI